MNKNKMEIMQISLKDLMKTIFVKFKRAHVLFRLFVFCLL